jgi:hypothetical protein
MPLSSIVGAQSIVKPGVCTSSTKPASPFDGQVIYMTDADQTAVWDGSSWVGIPQTGGSRNKIINGGMSVWQRGTSFADPANMTGYTADRWAAVWGTTGRTFARHAGFSNARYCLRVQRNSGSTGTGNSGIATFLETVNSIPLQGKKITLSFDARCGANYSAAGSQLNAYVFTGTGIDESALAWYSPGWTGSAQIIGQGVTLTTTSQRFTLTGTVSSTATQIAVYFIGIPTGTAGTNDYWEITNVQLEEGAVATPFDFEDFETTLRKCQRYFEKSFQLETAPAHNTQTFALINYLGSLGCGGNTYARIDFKVTKRTNPVLRAYDPYASHPANENWWRSFGGCSGGTAVQNGLSFSLFQNYIAGYAQYATDTGFAFEWTAEAEL